jgi:hypothetical protein
LPESQRTLLFLAGYLCNELSTLHNLISWALAERRADAVQEDAARTSQTLFLLRLLVSKLYEAKNSLRQSFLDTNVLEELCIDEKAQKGLDAFISMMEGDGDLFQNIRNKLGFHTDDVKLIENSLKKIPLDAHLHIYSGSHRGARYYQFADIGVLIMMVEQTGQIGLSAITRGCALQLAREDTSNGFSRRLH